MKKFILVLMVLISSVLLVGCSIDKDTIYDDSQIKGKITLLEQERDFLLEEFDNWYDETNRFIVILQNELKEAQDQLQENVDIIAELQAQIEYLESKRYITLSKNNINLIVYTDVKENKQRSYSIKADPDVKSLYIDLWDYTINILYNSVGTEYTLVLDMAYCVITYRT